jgi:hypothetical protein
LVDLKLACAAGERVIFGAGELEREADRSLISLERADQKWTAPCGERTRAWPILHAKTEGREVLSPELHREQSCNVAINFHLELISPLYKIVHQRLEETLI